MFTEFRAEIAAVLAAALPDVPLWPEIPEDIAEVPCVVVGRPGGRPANQAVVLDLSAVVFIVGRRQQAGGAEDELTALADEVFDALGGTRGVRGPSGWTLAVSRIDPRQLQVAGQECPAYTVEVEASATTC